MGRKRKPGKRKPSGRLVQLKERPDDVAVDARVRLYGVSREAARRAETGTAIGRLVDWSKRDSGELTQRQHAALVIYREAEATYRWAMDQKRLRSASDFSAQHGYDAREGDEPDYVRAVRQAREKFNMIRLACFNTTPLAEMVLQSWVLDDTEMWKHLGELRLCANAIDRLMEGD